MIQDHILNLLSIIVPDQLLNIIHKFLLLNIPKRKRVLENDSVRFTDVLFSH